MNDPGLDKPISDAEQTAKHVVAGDQKDDFDDNMDEEEEERNFLLPAKWWYASTAFPLMAGTFGPMANAFSICALVENWRVKIPPQGTEEHGINIKDPKWLIAVNAVSLVCALVANLSLLLNMARRVPFKYAQPITIIGFWVASILLIALVAVAAHDFHAPGVKHQALTQAYYYGIFAAGLYQIISYLMCVTVYGAYKGHYSKEFKLTVAQRTLMLQTISFLVYQLLGALVYSRIEGWQFLDAVYWADFTSLTIGIGADYTPKTHLGRGLLFPFALGGIIILGLVVGSIRSLVLDRGKKKMSARVTEKTRRRLVKQVAAALENKRSKSSKVMGIKKDVTKALTLQPGDNDMSETDRRRAEFEAMRRVQEISARERQYIGLAISGSAFAFLWTIGALVFFKAEKNQDWSYFEALYFSYTTLLTIGYGDFQPISNSGKPFFVFWSLLAIPTLTILISNMGDTVVKFVKESTIWLGEVTVLPSDQGSTMERLRYGLYKMTLGRVDPDRKVKDEEDGSDEDGSFQELHPGLAKVFKAAGARRRPGKKTKAATDRMAADFEESEKIEEKTAKDDHDPIAEDEHHYRRILLSKIRQVYNDSTASTPKKYSYEEWSEFLKLLGEDEEDSTFHRRAPMKTKDRKARNSGEDDAAKEKREFETGGQEGAEPGDEQKPDDSKNGGIMKWSWIGSRSPLMGDKDESEWLLEKFFKRLEESMHDRGTEKEHAIENTNHSKRIEGTEGDDSLSSDSSDLATLAAHENRSKGNNEET